MALYATAIPKRTHSLAIAFKRSISLRKHTWHEVSSAHLGIPRGHRLSMARCSRSNSCSCICSCRRRSNNSESAAGV
eukprot:9684594-Karenia_brevis.AAC.1